MARVKPGESHSYAEYDPNYERSLREEWREMNPFNRGKSVRTKHEIWWGKSSYFAGVGFIAFIVWIASLLLKSMIPAKWKVITWTVPTLEPESISQFSSVQLLSCVQFFVTPWTVAHQASCASPSPRVCSNSCPSSW